MENENKEEVKVENSNEDTGIVTHSLESDMKDLGVTVDEESIEPVQAQKEEVIKEQPKKMTRKERRVQKLANENKKLKERLAEVESKQSEQTVKEEVSEINIDDYDSFDDYEKALQEQEKTLKEKDTAQKEELTESNLDYEAQQDMLEDGIEDYEDFEKLVTAPDLALTEDVLSIVLESDTASDIAYYLATHKDETREIAEMTPRKMQKALLKIEMKLEASPKQKSVQTTNAPEPIKPVSGQSVKGKSLNDSDLSYEEHEALLNARTANNAGGFI